MLPKKKFFLVVFGLVLGHIFSISSMGIILTFLEMIFLMLFLTKTSLLKFLCFCFTLHISRRKLNYYFTNENKGHYFQRKHLLSFFLFNIINVLGHIPIEIKKINVTSRDKWHELVEHTAICVVSKKEKSLC